ncbi:MAG: response regulator [Alphaproteobacteria bacterium]|nr:response regulator [Alphaproteobacteria bacterium]
MGKANDQLMIVMVEDDAGHARLIQKNLQRAGITNELKHFETGKQAIEFFLGEGAPQVPPPCLILLDLNLPEVDGYEVLTRLKGDARTRTVPVIILTTTDNPREIDRCYALGCNVYITKPVEYEKFADSIRKLGLMLAVVRVPNGH